MMSEQNRTPPAARSGREDAECFVLTRELLGISDYEVFQRAYAAWYGREPDRHAIEAPFGAYLRSARLPVFVRHYVRRYVQTHPDRVQTIIDREARAWRLDRVMIAVVALLVVLALLWGMWR
jgi:hypothetical protein